MFSIVFWFIVRCSLVFLAISSTYPNLFVYLFSFTFLQPKKSPLDCHMHIAS